MYRPNCDKHPFFISNFRPLRNRIIGLVVAYLENLLSQYLSGFRVGYNTQQAIIRCLEKCNSVLEKRICRNNFNFNDSLIAQLLHTKLSA